MTVILLLSKHDILQVIILYVINQKFLFVLTPERKTRLPSLLFLPEAVCREVAEEMGLRVVVKDLAFVIEGLHGEKFHRVDLVFLCEYIGKLEG